MNGKPTDVISNSKENNLYPVICLLLIFLHQHNLRLLTEGNDFYPENLEERYHLVDVGIGLRIMLKCIL